MTTGTGEPLAAPLLRALPAPYSADAVDRVWLFATRSVAGRRCGLAVLAMFDADAGDARRILTLQYQAASGAAPPEVQWEEQAVCPADRVERVIHGVGRRLGAEDEPVRLASPGGSADAWFAFLTSLEVPAREYLP